jgi:ATP-dependent helicase/nuclease subunit B
MATDPAVFTIPPGRPFLDLLAAGVLQRWGKDPLELSRITILLPTRRACRALAEAFLRLSDGAALLLPQIQPLGDIDEDELELRGIGSDGGEAQPFSAMDRSLLLARLVLASPLAGHDPANALRLARELGHLLDAVATEETSLDKLPDLVPLELAGHWQQTLDFLQVIRQAWPAIKSEQGRLDTAEYRQRLTQRWIEHWVENPPTDPVIAAGSTGTIPATARLLKLVARLPQGAVVLPGLDSRLDDAAWQGAPIPSMPWRICSTPWACCAMKSRHGPPGTVIRRSKPHAARCCPPPCCRPPKPTAGVNCRTASPTMPFAICIA